MPVPLRRRAVLGGAVATLVAGAVGCGTTATGGPGPGADTDTDADTASDAEVAADGAVLAAGLGGLVAGVVAAHPGLGADLAGLEAAHSTHLDLLTGPGTATPGPGSPTTPVLRRRARALVERDETAAVATYAELAGRADGGRLAVALATAGAGLAQQLAVLSPTAGPPLPATGPLPATPLPDGSLAALQTALESEHAAVWTLGVVGARVPGSEAPDLLAQVESSYGRHRDRRDVLSAAVRAAGSDPAPASPTYEDPDLGDGTDGLRAATRRVEDRCASTYAATLARTTGDQRAWATRALVDAAVRVVDLGGSPRDLPGT